MNGHDVAKLLLAFAGVGFLIAGIFGTGPERGRKVIAGLAAFYIIAKIGV